MKKILFIFALILILSSTAFATTIVPMNMDQIKEKAGHIFYGKCVDVKEVTTENGIPATEVTYKVLRGVRGAEEKTITFRTLSNAIGGSTFYKGKESVLFLHRESPIGLTSPVGLNQGDIEVRTMRDGTKRVMLHEKMNNGNAVSPKSFNRDNDMSVDEFLDVIASE